MTFALAVWAVIASATPPINQIMGPVEEVVVYGEPFARWDDTRWLVQVEAGSPWDASWQAFQNSEFRVRRYQVHMAIHCNIEHNLAPQAREVSCGIDDIAFFPELLSVENKEQADRVLADWTGWLSGAEFQLQVTADGRVTDIGLEGVRTDDRRSRAAVETVRSTLAGGLSGFHIHDAMNQLSRGRQWADHTQAPWQIPSHGAHPVSGEIVHRADAYQGWIVVQSVGKATMTVTPDLRLDARGPGPEGSSAPPLSGPLKVQMSPNPMVDPLARVSFPPPALNIPMELAMQGEGRQRGSEMYFQATLDGVALFDPESGVMKERVTRMFAVSTASSSLQATAHTIVRLRQLEDEETVQLPPNGIIEDGQWPTVWY